MVLLDRGDVGGRPGFAHAASVDGADFCRQRAGDVWHVASHMGVDEDDKKWFSSVGYYVQNEDEKMPPCGTLQRGAKIVVLGFCSLYGAAFAQWTRAVVH